MHVCCFPIWEGEGGAVGLTTRKGGHLGSVFAGYVRLASQNPYPIIVYFWSMSWPIIVPILVTFGHYRPFLVFFLENYRPHLSHFWEPKKSEKVRPHSNNPVSNA